MKTSMLVPMLAAVSVDEIVHFVWMFLIMAAVFGILWGILLYVVPFSETIKKWIRVVLLVLGGFALIAFLLSLAGHPVLPIAR